MEMTSNKTLILLVITMFCAVDVCESSRAALRKLALQFKLLQKGVNADIDGLRNEVIELQYQLGVERARADNLEAFVNASEGQLDGVTVVSGDGNNIQYQGLQKRVKQQEKEIDQLNDEVENLKKESQKLQQIEDDIDKQELQLIKVREDIQEINRTATQLMDLTDLKNDDLENNIGDDKDKPLSIMRKAFMDEKNALKKLRHQVKEELDDRNTESIKQIVVDILEDAVKQEIRALNNSCEIVRTDMSLLESDILEMRVNLTTMKLGIDVHEKSLEELQKCCEDKKVVLTFAKEDVKVSPAITGQSNYTGSKDYTVYALFGEDMANNIRIGSRVIRGKDWAWGVQDGYGPGTVVSWYQGSNTSRQVDVQWDVGRKVNYRIGAHNRYDLYIITGGVDGHLKGTTRFKPIFGKELESAITIGSRVVKGEDWSWGVQDKGGPGTVYAWYSGQKSTKQVMVDWDLASKANYRVGALGKYDLFLLADD